MKPASAYLQRRAMHGGRWTRSPSKSLWASTVAAWGEGTRREFDGRLHEWQMLLPSGHAGDVMQLEIGSSSRVSKDGARVHGVSGATASSYPARRRSQGVGSPASMSQDPMTRAPPSQPRDRWCGVRGGHLVVSLLQAGHEVVVVDDLGNHLEALRPEKLGGGRVPSSRATSPTLR